jgi:hypothetical protein
MRLTVSAAFVCAVVAGLWSATVASAQTAAAIVPIEWPRPVYPQIAQSARVTGKVELAVDVRPDGSVAAVEALAVRRVLHLDLRRDAIHVT